RARTRRPSDRREGVVERLYRQATLTAKRASNGRPPFDHGRVTVTAAEREEGVAQRRRGTLCVYLGAAPGVGKTFAMLNEGRRRGARGTDVVVGFVETHGRARTAEQIGDGRGQSRSHNRER